MPEPEVVSTETAPGGTPPALTVETPPTETALTRTEIAELIAAETKKTRSELKADFERAYKAAQRVEAKADAANAKLMKQDAINEALATRGMDEGEARLWKAERAVERATETSVTVTQQQEYEAAARNFQDRSASFLNSEGIRSDDPRLTSAFSRYASEAKTYDDWDKALLHAVADVHRDASKQATAEAKTLADKAREDERTKLRNEQRASDGLLDKGTPASTAKFDSRTATAEEFKAYDDAKTAARLQRQRQLR